MNQRLSVDPSLLAAASAGDPAALDAVLRAVWPHAYRIALSILRRVASAEDAAQNACAVLMHAIARLREPGAFGVWVYRIVVREALALERRAPAFDELEPEAFVSTSGLSDADVRIDVLRALASLTSSERAAIALHYYGEATSTEIGAILGMPNGTVRYHLARARKKLETLLDAHRPACTLKGAVRAD
ncbi:MAG: sigma-70 family RNA polymerase sigma factor [bacterium]|nr:sigma-70 family RNA polymerase sigma factor [bacterium]